MKSNWKATELYDGIVDIPQESARVRVLRVGVDDESIICFITACRNKDGEVNVGMSLVGTGDIAELGSKGQQKEALGFVPDTHVEHTYEDDCDGYGKNGRR